MVALECLISSNLLDNLLIENLSFFSFALNQLSGLRLEVLVQHLWLSVLRHQSLPSTVEHADTVNACLNQSLNRDVCHGISYYTN